MWRAVAALCLRSSGFPGRWLSRRGARAAAPQASVWGAALVAPGHAGSSGTRARTCVSCVVGRRTLSHEAPAKPRGNECLTSVDRGPWEVGDAGRMPLSLLSGRLPADGLGSRVPRQGRTEALCGGLSHLFPSDGSEGRSAEDSVLILLAPPSCVALRGGARELQRPEVARVCSSAGFFSAQMFTRVCLVFKAPGGPSGPTISPHDVGRGSVCVEHVRSCLTNNRRWKSAGFRERRSSPVFLPLPDT